MQLRYRPLEYDAFGNLALTGDWSTFSMTLVSSTAPQAHDDAYSYSHATSLAPVAAQGVTANDTGGGSASAVQLVGDVQHGTLTLNADGSFNYIPTNGYLGADAFSYQLHDGDDVSNVATVTINVTNALPIAMDDSYEVAQDHAAAPAEGVLDNDLDADGDPLAITIVTSVSHGVLDWHADGTFTYTPAAGYLGNDIFTYRASDPFGQSNLATVLFDVSDASAVARNDSYSVVHGQTLIAPLPGVLSNDGFAGGPALTVSLVSDVSHGSLTLNSDGSFQYVPAAGFAGDDAFTYQATDGGSITGTAAGVLWASGSFGAMVYPWVMGLQMANIGPLSIMLTLAVSFGMVLILFGWVSRQ